MDRLAPCNFTWLPFFPSSSISINRDRENRTWIISAFAQFSIFYRSIDGSSDAISLSFLKPKVARICIKYVRRIFSADTDTKFTDTVAVKNTATCRYFRAKHILLRFCVSLSCQIFGTKVLPNFNAKFKTLAPN